MKTDFSFNKRQKAAFELIQSDARFFYTFTDISKKAKKIKCNYILMCQPYIGIFADGAEQWCNKMKLNGPLFDNREKTYYTELRQKHKLLGMSYEDYSKELLDKLKESDKYFQPKIALFEKVFGYYNVGTDFCDGEYCGNTILCALHTPIDLLGNRNAGIVLRDISEILGKIAYFFDCTRYPFYRYDENMIVTSRDYHFYKNCPLKQKNEVGFILFSILCNINYVIVFIDKFFVDEIPQKFKFAYLLYYYLCDFIKEINLSNGTNFELNEDLKSTDVRNCLAHYGLGPYMRDDEIDENDILKGITIKAFNLDYYSAKKSLYRYLNELTTQIKAYIF